MDRPVVGGVLVHMTTNADRPWEFSLWGLGSIGFCQAHCWVLRQQARGPLAPVWGVGGGVVAPLGGGVWCLIRG